MTVRGNKSLECLRDENHLIVAWLVGYSDNEIERLLSSHPGWYRSQECF